MTHTKKQAIIYLEEEKIKLIDEEAKRLYMNRSSFISFIFDKHLEKILNE